MLKIDTTIFRDYDIRGIYPTQINEDTYYLIGRAIATYLQVDRIALGHDMRLSSPSLFSAMSKGLMDQGVDVINLGLISTEMHYFASGKYQFPANIIISASHNPAEYNGLKIVKKNVVPLHGNFGLPEIRKLAVAGKFPIPSRVASMKSMNIMDDWINHALSIIDKNKLKSLKVIVDAGNGMGGISWMEIVGKTKLNIIPMYATPDGSFPHHLPDPLNEDNVVDLKKRIKIEKADVGIALDGDADRFFVIDEKSHFISGTITTAILSNAILEKKGKGTILYNSVCGKIVPETIISLGGTPIRTRVGHSFIKEKMKETNALFAGEHSGHFYFSDNFNADSSLVAGLIFLEYLSHQGLPLSEVTEKFNKYVSSSEINFRALNTDQILKSLEKEFKNATRIDHLDGLSIWYADWWANIRASKTEPYLRLNIEADNHIILNNNVDKVKNVMESLGAELI